MASQLLQKIIIKVDFYVKPNILNELSLGDLGSQNCLLGHVHTSLFASLVRSRYRLDSFIGYI